MKFDPLLFSKFRHTFNYFVHSSFGIPGTQLDIRIIHQAVERRRVFGQSPQEDHGELHQLPESGMAKMFSHVGFDVVEYIEPEQALDQVHIGKLQQRLSRLEDQLVDTNAVLVFSLFHESIELGTCAGLHFFKQGLQGLVICRNIHLPLIPIDPVGRIKSLQLIILLYLLSKTGKIPFENVWHPVPTRTHIEGVSIFFELPCPSSRLVVLFKKINLPALLGKKSGCG